MPMETFISMGAKINPAISNVFTFVILAVAPFNLIKSIIVGVITILLYKYLSRLIKVH
jgi:riboflavin transporter FmnP